MQDNDLSIWAAYVNDKLAEFLKSSDFESMIEDESIEAFVEQVSNVNQRQGFVLLKNMLGHAGAKRFSERFRAHKYRNKRKKRTLVVHESTYVRIQSLKDFTQTDTVDDALDHVLSAQYSSEIEDVRRKLGDDEFKVESLNLLSFSDRLTRHDRFRLLHLLQQSFSEGWKAAKNSRSRKATAASEAMESYQLLRAMSAHLTDADKDD